jgi:hypothetical protein
MKWFGRMLLAAACVCAIHFAPFAFFAAFVLAAGLLFWAHWGLFVVSKPVFEWVLRHEVSYLDISKDGELYLRRFYLTPRLHLPEWLLSELPSSWASALRKRIFLHWIVKSDDDRDPHDHPWAFVSHVLDGFGIEKVWFPQMSQTLALLWADLRGDGRYYPLANQRAWGRQYIPGITVDNPADHTHMLEVVKPLWTLVVVDARERQWGFWEINEGDPMKDRWTDQETYKKRGTEIRPQGEAA